MEGESIYFVTWRLHPGQPALEDDEQQLTMGALRHFDGVRYHLLAFVVMNDHVHVLLTLVGDHQLAHVLHSWKSFTAHKLRRDFGRPAPVWQDEYFDRVVRDEEELCQKVDYVSGNPQKRWAEVRNYRWVWTKWDERANGNPELGEA